jgi:hypothetical protein
MALHGQRYIRKVQHDTGVTVGAGRYYTTQALVGKHVTLRIDATDHTFVVDYESKEVKRVPIQGTGRGRIAFAQFVELLCSEARTRRIPIQRVPHQLPLPL